MMKKIQWITAVVLLALIFSTTWTVPAYADDSAPPPAEPTTEESTTPENSAPVESVADEDIATIEEPTAAAEESATVEEATQEENSAPAEEIAPEETPAQVEITEPAEDASLTEILEQMPEGTEVVVTDEAGEALPLVTEEAAEVVVNGDPQWCPTGVAPGGAGCSPAFDYFTKVNDDGSQPTWAGLIAWLNHADNALTVSKAGTIWIAWNYDDPDTAGTSEVTPIELNGSAVASTMETFALTIQGGWGGTLGSTLLKESNPMSTSTLSVPLWLTGWKAAVTLKNIVFDNVTYNGANSSALLVETTGNILLDQVKAENNTNASGDIHGATLDNRNRDENNGAELGTGLGTVTINNSAFNKNDGNGLEVYSDAIVTTNNLIANQNAKGGVIIDNDSNTTATPDKTVTMKGFKEFNDNTDGDGLRIFSKGAISLGNIIATNNGGHGLSIDNRESKANAGVTINGSNYFNNNGDPTTGYGAYILTHGIVTLNSINASDNGNSGVFIDNCDYDAGTQKCKKAPVAMNVLLTGINTFNHNAEYGLEVYASGMITINNVNASYNLTEDGVFLKNIYSPTKLGVSVLGTNYFTNNGNSTGDLNDWGIYILSRGAISTNNITASYNAGGGAFMDNCGNTSICYDATIAKTVVMAGYNTFNSNQQENGLKIYSFGAVTLNNITATGNDGSGAYISNQTKTDTNLDALITTYAYSVGTVTLNGYGIFNSNATGLFIASYGNVTLNNLTANLNTDVTGAGVNINTVKEVTGTAAVAIKGYNTFNNNANTGLMVVAEGAISVSNVSANLNGVLPTKGRGLDLDNTSAATSTIILTGFINTNNNTAEGVLLASNGAVTISNLFVDSNGSADCDYGDHCHGVYVSNTNSTTPQNVTINGFNTISNNEEDGLHIESYGLVTLSNIVAHDNTQVGVFVDNKNPALPTATKGVTINRINVSAHTKQGLYINTLGPVILNYIWADNNGGVANHGVEINNKHNTASPQNVTIGGLTNIIFSSGNDGLHIESYGIIGVSYITSNDNLGVGVSIDNSSALTTAKGVTVTGINVNGNTKQGLYINAHGLVSVSNAFVSANSKDTNTYNGVEVTNNFDNALPQDVKFNGANTFLNNGKDGLFVLTFGAIALNNINASGNGGDGAYVDNCKDTTACGTAAQAAKPKTLILTGINTFNNNLGDGLQYKISGTVTGSKISANGNTGNGISGDSTGAATLSCVHTYGNSGAGYSLTGGLVTFKGLFAFGNTLANSAPVGSKIYINIACP
jgi:hypothetical protein